MIQVVGFKAIEKIAKIQDQTREPIFIDVKGKLHYINKVGALVPITGEVKIVKSEA